MDKISTGDLILNKINSFGGNFLDFILNSKTNHVGMAVWFKGDKIISSPREQNFTDLNFNWLDEFKKSKDSDQNDSQEVNKIKNFQEELPVLTILEFCFRKTYDYLTKSYRSGAVFTLFIDSCTRNDHIYYRPIKKNPRITEIIYEHYLENKDKKYNISILNALKIFFGGKNSKIHKNHNYCSNFILEILEKIGYDYSLAPPKERGMYMPDDLFSDVNQNKIFTSPEIEIKKEKKSWSQLNKTLFVVFCLFIFGIFLFIGLNIVFK